MCAGAVLLYRIPRVVIGENRGWEPSEDQLRAHGIDVVVLDIGRVAMMRYFIDSHLGLWNEVLGVAR